MRDELSLLIDISVSLCGSRPIVSVFSVAFFLYQIMACAKRESLVTNSHSFKKKEIKEKLPFHTRFIFVRGHVFCIFFVFVFLVVEFLLSIFYYLNSSKHHN